MTTCSALITGLDRIKWFLVELCFLLSPEFILGEHVRLGSSVAILSRAFHNNADSVDKLKTICT